MNHVANGDIWRAALSSQYVRLIARFGEGRVIAKMGSGRLVRAIHARVDAEAAA